MRATCLCFIVLLALVLGELVSCTGESSAAGSPRRMRGIHPIVNYYGYLAGGTVDGQWKSAREMAKLVRGGETYRVYANAALVGKATGGRPDRDMMVQLRPDFTGVALGATWNAIPRKPKGDALHIAADKAAVRSILDRRGLRKSRVSNVETLRVDIEGDGKSEWIISAGDMDPSSYRAGDYSVVVVRKVSRGRSDTRLIAGDFHVRDSGRDVSRIFTTNGLYDLDGDGVLEVVVDVAAPALESYGTDVYKTVGGGWHRVAGVRPNYDYRLH